MRKDITQSNREKKYPSATRNQGPFYWPDDFTPARWFDDFFGSNLSPFSSEESRSLSPAIDIDETDNEYLITADLPGVKEEDIAVDCSGNLLTISAERKYESEGKKSDRRERFYGVYQRSFTLPPGADADKIEATYDNGVLMINVPKAEPIRTRKISLSKKEAADKENDEKLQ